MPAKAPSVIVLAGPNGAGKSTTAPSLLRGTLGVGEFVNADTIAQGLAGFNPDRAAIPAGRVMTARLKEPARQRVSFAFESTLASRTLAPWLSHLVEGDYRLHLIFLWLPTAGLAVVGTETVCTVCVLGKAAFFLATSANASASSWPSSRR